MKLFPRHKVACAVMVLNQDNKILLVKNRLRGWEFPGGYLEEGEAIRAGAVREVKEESGIDILLKRFCGIVQYIKRSTCVLLFSAEHAGGKLKTSPESLGVGYFTIDEALKKITTKIYKDRIFRCLNEEEFPFIIET